MTKNNTVILRIVGVTLGSYAAALKTTFLFRLLKTAFISRFDQSKRAIFNYHQKGASNKCGGWVVHPL